MQYKNSTINERISFWCKNHPYKRDFKQTISTIATVVDLYINAINQLFPNEFKVDNSIIKDFFDGIAIMLYPKNNIDDSERIDTANKLTKSLLSLITTYTKKVHIPYCLEKLAPKDDDMILNIGSFSIKPSPDQLQKYINRTGDYKPVLTMKPDELLQNFAIEREKALLPLKKKQKNHTQNNDTRLVSLFQSVAQYRQVMVLLADKGYIETSTYIWKNFENGHKGVIVGLIRALHTKGYFGNRKCPSFMDIICIANNDFKVKIGERIAKTKEPVYFDYYSFIPVAAAMQIR